MPAQRFSVGLTGGIGSGKSTVASLFGNLGAGIIDTDLIAHQLTAAGGSAMPQITAGFGSHFIQDDGAMNRSHMRQAVFADPGLRHRLEAILHPLIRSETARVADETDGIYLIYVVPLLVESAMWMTRVSRILVVDCAEDTQVRRVMQRNAMTEVQVRSIMATQASRPARLAAADDVILNDGEEADLLLAVRQLHAQYLSLAISM